MIRAELRLAGGYSPREEADVKSPSGGAPDGDGG